LRALHAFPTRRSSDLTVRQDSARRLTIFDQRYVERRGRRRAEHRFTLTFRTLSLRQMANRLDRAGFVVDHVLGDYRGGPWDARRSEEHTSELQSLAYL